MQALSPTEVEALFAETDTAIGAANDKPPDPLVRFVEIQKRLREIEEEEKRLKAECEPLAERLLDEWADKGQKNANLGGMTVYIRQDFYCNKRSGVPTEAVCSVLNTLGLGHLVAPNYSAATLKSMVKEWNEADQVPEELKPLLSYDTVPRLVAVKG